MGKLVVWRRTAVAHLNALGRSAALLVVLAASMAAAADDDAPRNWFNDPFFQVTDAIPNCPLPAGPLLTETERRVQAHHRAERGTCCWLNGDCEQASAYAHDSQIADSLRARWQAASFMTDASLWITVQHGVVFVEGCVPPRESPAQIEAFVKATPQVQHAVVVVQSDPKAKPAYKVR